MPFHQSPVGAMTTNKGDLGEEAFQLAIATIMKHSSVIKLNPERIAELVSVIPERPQETPSLTLPLRFAEISEEVNFACLLHLLSFGAFFREHIAAICGNAPNMYEHALRGVLSMFLYGKLDADRLINISITDIESAFQLPLSKEERLDNMPAFINVDAPTKQFASDIVKVLHETGRLLNTHRVASMGEYVMQFLSSHQRENAAITASELALDLAKTFPAFNDKPFYSKACGLLCTLYWSFKDRIPPMRFRHMSKLCPESDAEMVDFFYDRGVIELEGDADKVPIAVLRSAVVVAVRQLQMNLQSSRQLSLSVVELNSILHEMHRSDVKAASRDGSPPDRPYCIPPSFYL